MHPLNAEKPAILCPTQPGSLILRVSLRLPFCCVIHRRLRTGRLCKPRFRQIRIAVHGMPPACESVRDCAWTRSGRPVNASDGYKVYYGKIVSSADFAPYSVVNSEEWSLASSPIGTKNQRLSLLKSARVGQSDRQARLPRQGLKAVAPQTSLRVSKAVITWGHLH
jgi:hypothetical protein